MLRNDALLKLNNGKKNNWTQWISFASMLPSGEYVAEWLEKLGQHEVEHHKSPPSGQAAAHGVESILTGRETAADKTIG